MDLRWDVAPYLISLPHGHRPPLVLDIDAPFGKLNRMAPFYRKRPPLRGAALALRLGLERRLLRRASLVTPWSTWAADGLRQAGVPDDRIRVIPPGVDLELWKPRDRHTSESGDPLRMLFVGGDFHRKGGDTLLRLVGGPLAGRVTLDIVTHADVEPVPDVRIHRAGPNSPELQSLYAAADLFVLPTRAECFGIAAVEAMATGIPVLISDVGGARDIVVQGETGWLTTPSETDVLAAIENALSRRDELQAMGMAARSRAEQCFDAHTNHRRLVELILELAAVAASGRSRG